MFRTVSLSIIRSLALYTQQQVYVIQVMLTACQRDQDGTAFHPDRATKQSAYVVQSVRFQTEFFALVRSVVTTTAARGIISKVSWASVLKASFLCASRVTQLQFLSRGAMFSLRLSRWRISVNNALASNPVSSQGKLLQNVEDSFWGTSYGSFPNISMVFPV